MLYTNTILHDRLWILSNFFYSFFFSPARTEHWKEEIPRKNIKENFTNLLRKTKFSSNQLLYNISFNHSKIYMLFQLDLEFNYVKNA